MHTRTNHVDARRQRDARREDGRGVDVASMTSTLPDDDDDEHDDVDENADKDSMRITNLEHGTVFSSYVYSPSFRKFAYLGTCFMLLASGVALTLVNFGTVRSAEDWIEPHSSVGRNGGVGGGGGGAGSSTELTWGIDWTVGERCFLFSRRARMEPFSSLVPRTTCIIPIHTPRPPTFFSLSSNGRGGIYPFASFFLILIFLSPHSSSSSSPNKATMPPSP